MGSLQLQVTELAKDVAKVEAAQEQHNAAHVTESRERAAQSRSAARWGASIVTTILLAGLADFIAIIAAHSH